MPRYPPLGVTAVVDGYRDYVNKVGSMARETERSHAQIVRLEESKFEGLIKGAGIAVGVIGGIAAAAKGAVTAVVALSAKLAIDTAPILDIEKGFNAIAEQAGRTGPAVLKQLQDVSAGTIRAADLMQLYNKGTTLLGEEFENIIPIMDQIIAQGAAIGLKPLQSVEDFTTGVARESKMILDNLGIVVKLEEAHKSYAESVGKTVDELTAQERQAALLVAAQTALEKTSKALPSLNEFASTTFQRLNATLADTKDEIGKALVPAFKELFDNLQDNIGPAAVDLVGIFKRDFIPTIKRLTTFIGANLPTAIKFAKNVFIFFGKVLRGLTDFVFKFVVPAFNWLYRIFVDNLLPIIETGIGFFKSLFGEMSEGESITDVFSGSLLNLIPPEVFTFIDNLKTKVGEWYTTAREWWEENAPKFKQAFIAIKDYIVNEFIPNALEWLAEKFAPVIENAQSMFDALIDDIPIVLAEWEKIKNKAIEVFENNIPDALEHLGEAWTTLLDAIGIGIGNMGTWWEEHGETVIQAISDIIQYGIELLGVAVELLARIINLAVNAIVGDWERVKEIFLETADFAAESLGDLLGGTRIGELLGVDEFPTSDRGRGQGTTAPGQTPAPVIVTSSGGPLEGGQSNVNNFNLTVNTNAPVEPVVADFRMMAVRARSVAH